MKRPVRDYGSLAKHRAFLGLPCKKGSVVPFPCDPSKVFATQVAGLAARLKAIGCRSVVLGLSGGLDSTLALLVADAAFAKLGLDRKGIHVYTMPGFGTTRRTKGNAERLCEGLGLEIETISIVKSVRQHLKDIGHDGVTTDVTYENAQARMRTMILMDKANMTGGIVLGTGDLSEIALGWSTYNGDHMSMFGVNAGVPKTVIRKVCTWYAERISTSTEYKYKGSGIDSCIEQKNAEFDDRGGGVLAAAVRGRRAGQGLSQCGGEDAPAPSVRSLPASVKRSILDIVATPVSPELKKGQVTEDTLGPYELHDFFLWNFIMNEMGKKDLQSAAEKYFASAFTPELIAKTLETFLRRFFTQAFKRNCAPDGIKVFPFELSLRDWWIPSDLGPVKL